MVVLVLLVVSSLLVSLSYYGAASRARFTSQDFGTVSSYNINSHNINEELAWRDANSCDPNRTQRAPLFRRPSSRSIYLSIYPSLYLSIHFSISLSLSISLSISLSLYIYIYVYILFIYDLYIYIYICICMYIYIYISIAQPPTVFANAPARGRAMSATGLQTWHRHGF